MPSRSDPASCHRVSSSSRRTGRGAQRFGIMPSRGLQLPTHRSRSLAIRHHAITRLDSGAKVARLNGPASCLRVSPFSLQTHRSRSLAIRRNAITLHMLQTHRSWRLAIRHHAVTRSDSGAQVARLSGRASCLRALPSLPRHMQRSGGQAFARKRHHPSSALD